MEDFACVLVRIVGSLAEQAEAMIRISCFERSSPVFFVNPPLSAIQAPALAADDGRVGLAASGIKSSPASD